MLTTLIVLAVIQIVLFVVFYMLKIFKIGDQLTNKFKTLNINIHKKSNDSSISSIENYNDDFNKSVRELNLD